MIPIIIEPEDPSREMEHDDGAPQPSKREKEWEIAIREHMEFEHKLFRKQRRYFQGLCGVDES